MHSKEEPSEIVIVWEPEKPIRTGDTTIRGVVMRLGGSGENLNAKVGLIDSELAAEDRAKLNQCKDLLKQMTLRISRFNAADSQDLRKKRHTSIVDAQKAFRDAGCDEFFGTTMGQAIVDEIAAKFSG